MEINRHSFNVESDLIESMPNHDSSVIISSKIDSLFDEFAGELTLLKSFPPGIDETDCHPEKEIRLTKRLLYDNSSPRPPEEIVSDNSNADIESFYPSPIPNEDSDYHMEEIDLYINPDDPMPSGIEEDDDDSKRDILILEELLDNYSLSLPTNESYHFDIPWKKLIYPLIRMTQCRRALRKMMMTLKGIFRSLNNCLTIIPCPSLTMSHTILIFLHLIVLLQNHQMVIQEL
nr:hypothetical protein [Tanacetum cinerariifolium]